MLRSGRIDLAIHLTIHLQRLPAYSMFTVLVEQNMSAAVDLR